jgi:hypothetical protein
MGAAPVEGRREMLGTANAGGVGMEREGDNKRWAVVGFPDGVPIKRTDLLRVGLFYAHGVILQWKMGLMCYLDVPRIMIIC